MVGEERGAVSERRCLGRFRVAAALTSSCDLLAVSGVGQWDRKYKDLSFV
jgi:hypothetical protein